jgi:uncharacterized membrane protein
MNPISVITTWLQEIPPNVRKYILLAYALVVVAVGICALIGLDFDFAKINMVLTIIGGYLGFQSAANVPAPGEGKRVAEEPDAVE